MSAPWSSPAPWLLVSGLEAGALAHGDVVIELVAAVTGSGLNHVFTVQSAVMSYM